MNYNSSEAAEYEQNKSGAQQSRTRLTLLADISETNPSLLHAQQQSPVLTYIRQLQDNKVQAEKENVSSFNRKISQSQDRNQKNSRAKQPILKQSNIRKQIMSNVSSNWQQPQNKSQSRHKNINQSHRMHPPREPTRPGIEKYKKIINLADPVDNLQNEYYSTSQNYRPQPQGFNQDKELLFCKELKKLNAHKYKS